MFSLGIDYAWYKRVVLLSARDAMLTRRWPPRPVRARHSNSLGKIKERNNDGDDRQRHGITTLILGHVAKIIYRIEQQTARCPSRALG